jgi:hypothetical protein
LPACRAATPGGRVSPQPPSAPAEAADEIPSPELFGSALRDFNETLQREREWRKQHSYPLNQFWGSANQLTMSSALSDSNSAEQAVGRILESELYVHHVDLVDISIEWHVRTYARLELDLDLDRRIRLHGPTGDSSQRTAAHKEGSGASDIQSDPGRRR